MKKFLSAFAILAAVCMISTSAFAAGTIAVASFQVAAELIGPTVDVAANAVHIGFSGVTAVLPDVVTLTLANGTWAAGSTIKICAPGGAAEVGTGTEGATATTTLAVTLANSLSPGTTYTIETTACGAADAPNPVSNILIAHGSVAGATLTLALSDPTGSLAPATTILTLVNQFTATLTPVTSTIDFNSVPSLTEFLFSGGPVPPLTTDANSEAALVIISNDKIDQKVPVGGNDATCNGTLDPTDIMQMTVTGNLSGIGEFQYDAFAATTIPSAVQTSAVQKVTGGALLICQAGSADIPLVAGQIPLTLIANQSIAAPTPQPSGTQIVPGKLTAQVTILGGGVAGDIPAGYTRDLVAAGTLGWTFNTNAVSLYIPYLSTNTGLQTFCVVDNTGAQAADVNLDVLSSESGLVQSALDLGTIPATTSRLVTFSGDSASMAGGNTVSITVGENTRFSGRLNVNAPVTNVISNCVQTDPVQGPKRLVPVLTNAGPQF